MWLDPSWISRPEALKTKARHAMQRTVVLQEFHEASLTTHLPNRIVGDHSTSRVHSNHFSDVIARDLGGVGAKSCKFTATDSFVLFTCKNRAD